MNGILLLTVDLGTTFIKTSAYNQSGLVIAQSSAKVKSKCSSPREFTQNGEDIFNSVINCLDDTVQQLGNLAKQVEAIAFTGQMSGFMGVDKHWSDITTWLCSMDSRYIPYAEQQIKHLGNKSLEFCGTNAPQMAPKCEWFKTEFKEQFARVAKCLMISGYIMGKLSDIPIKDAVIDKTYIHWTGLADVRKATWSDELCNAVGINNDLLPNIVSSNKICAGLSKKAAESIGLKSEFPLVSGAGDKIAGYTGSGVVDNGDTILEASSGSRCSGQNISNS